MFKQLTIGIMSVFLSAFAIAGCSNDKASSNDKVTLEMYSNKQESIQTYKKLIQEFEKQNPTIKINVETGPETVITTGLTKNDLPDIMSIGGSPLYGELGRAGVLHDFSEDNMLKKVDTSYVNMIGDLVGSDKKGVYGIPYAANAIPVIYNKTKFEELGLKVPKTWDEFIATLEKVKASGETPIYFTLKDSWTALQWYTLEANLSGGEFANKKNKDKTTFVKSHDQVADKMLTLLKYGHKDNFGVGYGDGNNAFANGESVFYLQGNWAIPAIEKANPTIKLGVFPLPVTNKPDQSILISSVDVLLAMNESTEHKDEAMKFINFMVDHEVSQKYIDEQKALPTIKGVSQQNPIFEGIKGNLESGNIVGNPEYKYPVGMAPANIIQEFLMEKDKKVFLKKMDKEWEKISNR
ncbi:extracellular solute-binding protein [Peribacillus muralis]|uniref:ABC transporter substrate-binding protein n=1 Tax=Peribacillus muralis TaxID=264697 RepID=UPI001F4EFBDD|nr:extracellular solute-binding protein [Peribacillus muralis]MCK1991048.1 extracellular solute-binding protein [Peribacillus muralis]MCK2011602.1 extracellular solute-binding protein [Peribacillus muralis]